MYLINDMIQNIVIDPLPNEPVNFAMKYLPLIFLHVLEHLSGEHRLLVERTHMLPRGGGGIGDINFYEWFEQKRN
jgi:hypothetical protein